MTSKRLTIALTFAVAAIAALVFLPALRGGWIYDDQILIADNPYAHSLQWWPRYWVTDFWNVNEEVVRFSTRIAYWRPIISTSYAVDWQLGGGSPLAYHITNSILQAIVGALTFATLRRWIGSVWPALLAALIFVVHPTKAESVAWISGRTDVVCMIAALMVTQGIGRRLRGVPGGLTLEVFGTLLAYTSKEQAIVLPAFAAIEAWVAADRGAIDFAMVKRIVRVALPQAIIAIVYLGIRTVVLPVKAINVEGGIRASDHFLAILESIGRFISLTFAPHDLSILQGLIHVAGGQPIHSTAYIILGVVGLIALSLAAWLLRKQLPFVMIGIGFYLFTLAPTSNIIYTQMETLISERFLYLPLLGMALIAGFLLARALPRRWPFAIAAACVCILSFQAATRSADYGDEHQFWARELELHPTSPVARRAMIDRALSENRKKLALVLTLDLMRTDVDYQDLPVAFEVAQLLSDLTPDHNKVRLQQIGTFAQELLQAKQPAATLDTDAVTFTLPTTTTGFKNHLEFYRLRIMMLAASIRSRLGDDAAAVETAKQAIMVCPRCPHVVTQGSLTLARAGYYDDALQVLEQARGRVTQSALDEVAATVKKGEDAHARAEASTGAAQLQAQAQELATMELWGRAYDVLAPYKDQIKTAPKFVIGFAELAYRAGETDVAREMLTGQMPPAQIDQQLEAWAKTMGWVE